MMPIVNWSMKTSAILGLALLALYLLRGRSAAWRHCLLSLALLCAVLVPALNGVVPSLDVDVGGWIPWFMTARRAPPPPQFEARVDQPPSETPPIAPEETSPQQSPPPGGHIVPAHDRRSTLRSRPRGVSARQSVAAPGEAQDARAEPTPIQVTTDDPPPPIPLETVLTLVWLVGAAFGFAALVIGTIRLAWIASVSERVVDPNWLGVTRAVSREYGLKRHIKLLRSRRPILATWGAIRPQVLLPATCGDWNEDRLNVVLSHELAHVRRGDWLIQMLAEALRAVQWFNPLVWVACARLHHESERACDDAVLNRGVAGESYAAHLLDLARTLKAGGPGWAPALMMARRSTLEPRFKAMLNPGLNRTGVTGFSMVVTTALCMIIVAPVIAFRVAAEPASVPPARAAAVLQPPVEGPSGIAAAEQAPASTPVAAGLPLVSPQPGAFAAVDGIVVRLGSNAPISGVDVELTRVEGVKSAPLAPGAAEAYAQTVANGRARDARPPSALAPEVQYARTNADGRFVFKGLQPGTYRLVAALVGGAYVPAEYGPASSARPWRGVPDCPGTGDDRRPLGDGPHRHGHRPRPRCRRRTVGPRACVGARAPIQGRTAGVEHRAVGTYR